MMPQQEVAVLVRVESDLETGKMYLVFEVTEDQFQRKIKENWQTDQNLILEGKKLVKYD